jgi:hypothetical protein
MEELLGLQEQGTLEDIFAAGLTDRAGDTFRAGKAGAELGASQRGMQRSPYADSIRAQPYNRLAMELAGIQDQSRDYARNQRQEIRGGLQDIASRDVDALQNLQSMKTAKTYESSYDAAAKQAKEQAAAFAIATIAKTLASMGMAAYSGGGQGASLGGAEATGATSAVGPVYADAYGSSFAGQGAGGMSGYSMAQAGGGMAGAPAVYGSSGPAMGGSWQQMLQQYGQQRALQYGYNSNPFNDREYMGYQGVY